MKKHIGPHKRRSIRRRRLKALVLAAVIMFLAILSSVTTWDKPEAEPVPSATELAYMRNVAKYSPGEAAIYAERWPEYADYILGK